MKEIILIAAVMAMFAFGFYIMDKVDYSLNDNYSRLEVMEHTSALRIAMEDSSIAASLSDWYNSDYDKSIMEKRFI